MNIYLAKWIQKPVENQGHAYWIRKTFEVAELPQEANLFCAAAGFYEVYINGQPADPERVLTPAPGQYDKFVEYTVYPVAHLLKPGKNVIVFLLGNGFYNCWEKDYSNLDHAPFRDFPKVMAYIETENTVLVKTDGTWKSAPSGVVFNSLRHGVFYDANKETPGVHEPGTDDSAWEEIKLCHPPGGIIKPEQGHPCKVHQKIDPVGKKVFPFGRIIYDFGVNIAGWCELTFTAPPGTTIYLEYGEMVRDNGDVEREFIHFLDNSSVFQEDRFTVGPSGRLENVHARFTWYGFRYVRMRAEHPDIKIEKIQACVIHNSFREIGSYSSSDSTLNALLTLTKRSYESNFMGIPTDCPHREKNGWTGDVQLACETGLFLYNAETDYGHFLDCVIGTQRPNGHLPCIAPSGVWGYNWGCGPAWDMVLFVLPYQIYRFTGNKEYIERYYPNMERYLDFCAQMEQDDGLLYNGLGDWCPVEHFRMTKAVITSTGCYYDMAKKMVFFAGLLGKAEDQKRYQKLSARIREAFRKAFFKEDGIVGDDTWTALGCAVFFGFADEAEAPVIAKRLVEKVRANEHKVDFGILGAKYVPHVLAWHGYADDALKLFTQPEYPGWGNWVKLGATTLWETWSGLWSRNHIMFGDIPNWCMEHLGGIRLDGGDLTWSPVFVNGLDRFECSCEIPEKGTVTVKWERKKSGVIKAEIALTGTLSCKCRLNSIAENISGNTKRTYNIRKVLS